MCEDILHIERINDRFHLIEAIGEGSYGCVTKGFDIIRNQPVALKRQLNIKSPSDIPERIIREIKILRSLEHHNVNKLYDVVWVSQERALYLSLEYCESDLLGMINKKALSTIQIKDFIRQLFDGLSYIHEQGIIHRDIKPANIFITKDNTIKLGDFGLATHVEKGRPATNKVITLSYRPLEILLGAENYGVEVDVWSMACVLYQMCTGSHLFDSKTTEQAIISQIIELCGKPDLNDWPEITQIRNYAIIDRYRSTKPILEQYLKNHIPKDFEFIIPVLLLMLVLNPSKRASAKTIRDMLGLKPAITNLKIEETHARESAHGTLICLFDKRPVRPCWRLLPVYG